MIRNLPTNQDVQLVYAGDEPGIIINRDIIQPVYFGSHSAFVVPGEASIIDGLTFVQYSGDTDIWAHSGGTSFCQVDVQPDIRNWSPSPAQSAASLATVGIPPVVPGVVGGDQILRGPSGSPYPIYTFPSAGKIWAASVSFSVAVNGVPSINQLYARVYIQGGQSLAYCEVVTTFPTDSGVNGDSNTFPGFAVPAGTQILLDINNGVGISGAGVALTRGGGIFVGSIP